MNGWEAVLGIVLVLCITKLGIVMLDGLHKEAMAKKIPTNYSAEQQKQDTADNAERTHRMNC